MTTYSIAALGRTSVHGIQHLGARDYGRAAAGLGLQIAASRKIGGLRCICIRAGERYGDRRPRCLVPRALEAGLQCVSRAGGWLEKSSGASRDKERPQACDTRAAIYAQALRRPDRHLLNASGSSHKARSPCRGGDALNRRHWIAEDSPSRTDARTIAESKRDADGA